MEALKLYSNECLQKACRKIGMTNVRPTKETMAHAIAEQTTCTAPQLSYLRSLAQDVEPEALLNRATASYTITEIKLRRAQT